MPENLRALIVILAFALTVFWIGRKQIAGFAIAENDFRLRRNVWIGITLAAFLGYSFWIYTVLAALLLLSYGAKDSNRLGMYAFVMFAVPPIQASIPGFGVINYLLDLDHLKLLSLTLLLPSYLSLRRQPDTTPFGRLLTDKFLLGYLIVQIGLQAQLDTTTNTARSVINLFIDVFLPYYVASRALRDLKGYFDVLTSFVFACMLMAPVAAFEYVKHWLLYSSLPGVMDLRFGIGGYLNRGDSLRALASMGHSLVLGYVTAIALAFYLFVARSITNKKMYLLGLASLVVCLIASLSRGPWVGAMAALLIAMFTGPNKFYRISRLLLFIVPVAVPVFLTDAGDKIIDLLPFVGTVDEGNVTYRQQLFTVSVEVIKMNPWFGSFDYLTLPIMQQLIQGEGIIDLVNSYLSIALTYGLVGLGLFSGVFLGAGGIVLKYVWQLNPETDEHVLGRALLAALVGGLIIIATVSSILAVPTVYWLLGGLCVGYRNLFQKQVQKTSPLNMAPISPRKTYG